MSQSSTPPRHLIHKQPQQITRLRTGVRDVRGPAPGAGATGRGECLEMGRRLDICHLWKMCPGQSVFPPQVSFFILTPSSSSTYGSFFQCHHSSIPPPKRQGSAVPDLLDLGPRLTCIPVPFLLLAPASPPVRPHPDSLELHWHCPLAHELFGGPINCGLGLSAPAVSPSIGLAAPDLSSLP